MATYTCKYCGYQTGNAMNANFDCRYSPHKHHEWMNTTENKVNILVSIVAINQAIL